MIPRVYPYFQSALTSDLSAVRELAAEGLLQVQIKKGHAFYAVAEKQLSPLD
jgi:hypothetical protein